MSEGITSILRRFILRLVRLTQNDHEFRGELRRLAQWVVETTEPSALYQPPPGEPAQPPVAVEELTSPPSDKENRFFAPPPDQSTTETLSPIVPSPPSPVSPVPRQAVIPAVTPPAISDRDLSVIAARCRLKAEGCRWASTRRQRLDSGAAFDTEIEPKDREIIARAKELPDCFLWMNHPEAPVPENVSAFDDLAVCYDVLADALDLVRLVVDDPGDRSDGFSEALKLLAEAQSCLRVMVAVLGGRPDPDQDKVFSWLKSTTKERQVYIQRYMRLIDPADPKNLDDLADRIKRLDGQITHTRQQERQRRSLMNDIRFHVKQLGQADDNHSHHWTRIAQSVDKLLEMGVPPSQVELREMLLPCIDNLPDQNWSRGFRLVLREIDRYQASRPQDDEPTTTTTLTNPQVTEVAALLRGKRAVLIGGVRRNHARRALVRAFELSDLDWVDAPEHSSITVFEPAIARSDTALVLLAVRWSSHSYSEIRQYCEQRGKPLVRLPAGYHANQVAAQIMGQAGDRLRKNVGAS